MKEIQLTQGAVALVDDEDFEWLSQHRWRLSKCGAFYATCKIKSKHVHMHRMIMCSSPMAGLSVDHINGNGLDNRRCNLRWATNAEQQANTVKKKDNRSGYKGVFPNRGKSKPWRSQIKVRGKYKFLGCFATREDAARAYDREARDTYGEFARLNFPATGGQPK